MANTWVLMLAVFIVIALLGSRETYTAPASMRDYRGPMAATNFPGGDLGGGFKSGTVAGCADNCNGNAQCQGFAVSRDRNPTCYLKGASAYTASNRVKDTQWTSYVRTGQYNAMKGIAAPAAPAAAAPGGGVVTAYKDDNYSGASVTYAVGEYSNVGGAWNDQISSLRIPAGMRVDLYSNENFNGWLGTYRADIPSLKSYGSGADSAPGGIGSVPVLGSVVTTVMGLFKAKGLNDMVTSLKVGRD